MARSYCRIDNKDDGPRTKLAVATATATVAEAAAAANTHQTICTGSTLRPINSEGNGNRIHSTELRHYGK